MITAIGLVIFVVFWFCTRTAVNYAAQNLQPLGTAFYVFAWGRIIGGLMALIGIAMWLWRHMP